MFFSAADIRAAAQRSMPKWKGYRLSHAEVVTRGMHQSTCPVHKKSLNVIYPAWCFALSSFQYDYGYDMHWCTSFTLQLQVCVLRRSQFLASILMLLRDDFLIYIPEGEMHHFSTFLL